MLRFLSSVIALIFISEVTLAAPKYCCYPEQWESLNYFRQGGIMPNGTVASNDGEEMVSVDTEALMINSMASITTGDQTYSIRTIQDFKNGKQYQIIGPNCTTTSIGAFTNKCVPDEAVYLTTDAYGFGSNELSVDIYRLVQGNVTVFLGVAKPDCIPMAVTSYGSTAQGSGVSSKIYSNITLGIKDRSVFNIPPNCQKIATSGYQQAHSTSWHGLY